MFKIIQNRKYGFVFSGIIVVLALASILIWGLKLGIDFTGGSLLELEFTGNRPEAVELRKVAIVSIGTDDIFVQLLGETGMVLRMPTLSEEAHQTLLKDLKNAFETGVVADEINTPKIELLSGNVEVQLITDSVAEVDPNAVRIEEKRFESVGPIIGKELRIKTIYAVLGAIFAVVLYITYVFRRVSKPVASWKYGACTIAALIHDVIVPVGVYAVLGNFYNVEVGAWIVTALLTILGFSVHDTIVVFDRIRENLSKHRRENFEETVNRSVNQSIARSINTSITLLFVLIAAYIFGGESLKHFLMVLIIGVSAGTYSSIFIASPLLVSWQMFDKNRRK